jgi:hypothetical protein
MVQDSVFTLHDGDSVLHEDANPLPLPACPFPSRPTVRTLSHLLSSTAKLTASGLVPPCWHADVGRSTQVTTTLTEPSELPAPDATVAQRGPPTVFRHHIVWKRKA